MSIKSCSNFFFFFYFQIPSLDYFLKNNGMIYDLLILLLIIENRLLFYFLMHFSTTSKSKLIIFFFLNFNSAQHTCIIFLIKPWIDKSENKFEKSCFKKTLKYILNLLRIG